MWLWRTSRIRKERNLFGFFGGETFGCCCDPCNVVANLWTVHPIQQLTDKCISNYLNNLATPPSKFHLFFDYPQLSYSLASLIIEQFVAYFDSMKFLIWNFVAISGLIRLNTRFWNREPCYSPGNNSITHSQVFKIQMKLTFWIWKMKSIFHTRIAGDSAGQLTQTSDGTHFWSSKASMSMVIRLSARY